MLFFELDFILLFLFPMLIVIAFLGIFKLSSILAWVGSLASLIFLYVYSFNSVASILFSLAFNFMAARYLVKHNSKAIFFGALLVNILILAYFKYSIFIDESFFSGDSLLTWKLALPLGISFYTFQQIAFLSDLHIGKIKSFSFKTYALFMLFFPQFIAGPITHFLKVAPSYERWPTFNTRSIRFGVCIFAIGLVKKLIGDYFGELSDVGFSNNSSLDSYTAWVSMLAFTFQIYFDFSGYSDMAIGLARIFGVNLPFNFNSPYKAISLSDFWRRWHITLSQWLRDYLYIVLGGNRYGAIRTAIALFITMALGGIWHGANWTFVVWGCMHGLGLITVRFFGFSSPKILNHILVFIFVMLSWVLFRAESLTLALHHYSTLIDFSNSGVGIEFQRLINLIFPFFSIDSNFNRPEQLFEITAILFAFLMTVSAPNSRAISLWFSAKRVHIARSIEIPIIVSIIVLICTAFISPDSTNAFIYFQF